MRDVKSLKILFFLLLILSLIVTVLTALDTPIPLYFFHEDVRLKIDRVDFLNITIYRVLIPAETSANESMKSITIILKLDPGGVYRFNVSGKPNTEIKYAGNIMFKLPENPSEIRFYVVDPYLNYEIPIGVYENKSFDTIAQTSEYSAYIIVDRVSLLSVECSSTVKSEIFLEVLRGERVYETRRLGVCSMSSSASKTTLYVTNLISYTSYVLIDFSFIKIRYQEDRFSIYPADNIYMFTALDLIFFSGLIFSGYRYYKLSERTKRARRKRSKKR